MSAYLKKACRTIQEFFSRNIYPRKRFQPAMVQRVSHSLDRLPPEKREKLKKLYEQLFKHRDFITSGRLQFIGLEAVRKKLGKQWPGLATVIYEIVESVMQQHLDADDLYIRYRDDAYSLIFARSNLMEGRLKAAAIANDIREKLFALDEDDLKTIELREAVRQIKMNISASGSVPDFLDELTAGWGDTPEWQPTEEEDGPDNPPVDVVGETDLPTVVVETENYRVRPVQAGRESISGLEPLYLPLWDVSRGALTTYLCLLHDPAHLTTPMASHLNLYRQQPRERILALDQHVLKAVMSELAAMIADNRKFLIACPVHYETLYYFEGYEEYKLLLAQIPEASKPFLVFYVTGVPETLPAKDPFWFGVPLQQFGRQVMLELPLARNAPFPLIRAAGIKDVSVCIEENTEDEQTKIKLLNAFSQRADSFKMGTLGVVGVPSLSLTTSSVCAGFGLVGGKAIHELVQRPDSIHRYQQEDLLKTLVSGQ